MTGVATEKGVALATYPQHKVKACLKAMGVKFERRKGRPHATAKFNGQVARWPNPHDDPLDDQLLSLILKQLGISREEFFQHY